MPNRQRAPPCPANVGDLVYLYCDANKSRARGRYLVTGREGQWLIIKKFAGTQLRNTAYRVRLSECYKVPYELPSVSASDTNIELCNGSVEDKPVPTFGTPVPPVELSTPPPPPPPPLQDSGLMRKPQRDSEGPPMMVPTTTTSAIGHNPLTTREQDDEDEVPQTVESHATPRRSERKRRPPVYLTNYIQ